MEYVPPALRNRQQLPAAAVVEARKVNLIREPTEITAGGQIIAADVFAAIDGSDSYT
jgi:hypothetical protein